VLSYAVLIEQIGGAPPRKCFCDWASAGSFNLQMGSGSMRLAP